MVLTKSDKHHAGLCGEMTAYLFQHLLFTMFESTRGDNDVKVEIFAITIFSTFLTLFLLDCASEPWIQIAVVTKPSPEERTNTLDVAIEVPISRRLTFGVLYTRSFFWLITRHAPFSVCMGGADHLWEVNDDRLSRRSTD
jgi:hypothetical protein